eukprot:gene6928-11091_t
MSEETLAQARKELKESKKKIEELEKLLKVYSEYVPKEKLKYLRATEEQTHLTIIQQSFKRKQNTQNLLKFMKKFSTSKLSQGLKERNNILKEIIKTESDYVNSLNYLNIYYKEPIINKKILKPNQISEIFLNLDDLIAIHTTLLEKLKWKMSNFPLSDFGSIILDFAPTFMHYIGYCNKYNEAMDKFNDLKNSKEWFNVLLEEQRKLIPGNHPFQSLFIQPIQRLPRYSLLLREVIKNTDEEHQEYSHFVSAKKKVDEILQLVNETKRKYDIERTIEKIDAFTKDLMRFTLDYTKFVTEDLAMVKFLPMKTKEEEEILGIECLLFLFKDIILVFEKTKKPRKVTFGGLLPRSPRSKVHFDKDNEIYVCFKNYYYLSDTSVVRFQQKCLGLISVDHEINQKVKLEFQLNEKRGTNRSEFWHENLLRYIDEADKNNDIYHINPSSTFF